MDLDVLRQVAEEYIPFNKFLGFKMPLVERGHIELEAPWRDVFIGDPMKQAVHGGVISALADAAGGMAIWSDLENPLLRVSTIDLRIDYLRPGKAETIVADATVVRVGRSVGVADVRVYHRSSPKETVATGKGVYAIKLQKGAHAARE